jgi:hypothetical protein
MKAAIIIPAYREVDHRLWRVAGASGIPSLVLHQHSDLPRVRSLLIGQALDGGAERIIFIDADTVPSAGTLNALAESEDVTPARALWGMYPLRQGDRWSVNPEDPMGADLAIREGRPFRIKTGGLGFCVIHRESLARAGAKLPTIREDTGLEWRPFCVPMVHVDEHRVGTYYADDGSLCVRLRETGTELWCDPRLRVGHAVNTVLTALRD